MFRKCVDFDRQGFEPGGEIGSEPFRVLVNLSYFVKIKLAMDMLKDTVIDRGEEKNTHSIDNSPALNLSTFFLSVCTCSSSSVTLVL